MLCGILYISRKMPFSSIDFPSQFPMIWGEIKFKIFFRWSDQILSPVGMPITFTHQHLWDEFVLKSQKELLAPVHLNPGQKCSNQNNHNDTAIMMITHAAS